MSTVSEEYASAIHLAEVETDAAKRTASLEKATELLEQKELPLPDVDVIVKVVRAGSKNAHQNISSSSLRLLACCSRRLTGDTQHARSAGYLVEHGTTLALDRVGDSKEKTRNAALEALVSTGLLAVSASEPAARSKSHDSLADEFISTLQEHGLGSKQAKVRHGALVALSSIRKQSAGLHIKALLTSLVQTLQDADPSVREQSKETIISIFQLASAPARADLHQEMIRSSVKKPLVETIMNAFQEQKDESHGTSASEYNPTIGSSVPHMTMSTKNEFEKWASSVSPHFEGKETEHNWMAREQSVIQLRGMLKSTLPADVRAALPPCVKSLSDGFIKAALSLRTTLATHSIALMEELAWALSDDMAPFADNYFNALLKMAGFTKKIIAQASQTALTAFLRCLSFQPSFLHSLQGVSQEKNPQVRIAVCQHITTLMRYHRNEPRLSGHKSHFETLSGMVLRGLQDSNKDCRTLAREAYWELHSIWPTHSTALMDKLDAAAKRQVLAGAPATKAAELAKEAIEAPPVPVPARRPNGASQAILAAKRAASQRLQAEKARELEEKASNSEPSEERSPGVDANNAHTEEIPAVASASLAPPATAIAGSSPSDSVATADAPPQPVASNASPNPLPNVARKDQTAFQRRAARLEGEAAPLTVAQEPVHVWVEAFASATTDLRFFRRLAKWSSSGDPAHHSLLVQPQETASLLQHLRSFVVDQATVDPSLSLAGLVALHRIVEHHHQAVALAGGDATVLDLIMDPALLRDRSMKSACQAVADAWSIHGADAVMQLRAVVERLPAAAGIVSDRAERPGVLLIGLRSTEQLLKRMPPEVIEDELPSLRSAFKSALNDESPEVRQGAMSAIMCAFSSLQDSSRIIAMLSPLTQSQQDLIMYYLAKRR